jgi:hypothetical protein
MKAIIIFLISTVLSFTGLDLSGALKHSTDSNLTTIQRVDNGNVKDFSFTQEQKDSLVKVVPEFNVINASKDPIDLTDIVKTLLSIFGGLLTTWILSLLHKWFPKWFPSVSRAQVKKIKNDMKNGTV